METNEISFENLPKAVAHLISELAEIKSLVEKGQTPVVYQKRIPIDIEEACRIIGKAKPTVYALVRKRMIPCSKNGKNSIQKTYEYYTAMSLFELLANFWRVDEQENFENGILTAIQN